MFCTMWPTLGGELSVVLQKLYAKKWTKIDQELGPKKVNFDKICIL